MSNITINTSFDVAGFLKAKSLPEDEYVSGPITVTDQASFWVLAVIKNESVAHEEIAENVRISFNMSSIDEYSFMVGACVRCDNVAPAASSIVFRSEKPFRLEYLPDSAFVYSEARGLHSDYGIQISDEVMTPTGALLGFDAIDGRIPGGENNMVTVSIKMAVVC